MSGSKQFNIMNSPRWIRFLESTALSLQLNLTLIHEGILDSKVQVPEICPVCQKPFKNLTDVDFNLAGSIARKHLETREILLADGKKAEFMSLEDGTHIIARDCDCITNRELPPLRERAILAQKLLASFLTALCEGIAGGKSSLELSALRQINQIMLSLFHGEPDIAERTFDLILSALIILLDSEASWLEYNQGSQKHCIIKGNRKLVEDYLKTTRNPDNLECNVVDISGNTPKIRGRLGVFTVHGAEKQASILPLMVQECSFVFEIEHLFFLLKAQLSRLLGALTSMVILVNEQSQIIYCNKSARSFFNEPALQFSGQPATQLPDFWFRHIQNYINVPVSDAKVAYKRDQEIILLDWQILPLVDEDIVAGWLILADDRTDYYHWQEVGRKAESFTAMASVIGPLAHELRNPLAATKGLLQLMQRRREPEKIFNHINLILREVDRMNVLVNKFLQLGRTARTHLEIVNLADFFGEILPLLIAEASEAGVEINYQLESVPTILADQGQITQVVLNLFRNAVEAAGAGGQVTINLKSLGDWVVLDLKNTGSEIPPEIMDRLFQPFVTTKEHGTGLGLAVAKAIITNHGGTITAANIPDYGVVFSVKLPAGMEKKEGACEVDVIICLADDMIRYPLEQVLQAAGYSTYSTKSFTEILEKKDLYEPIVVIVDVDSSLQDINSIQQIWPRVTLIFIGEPPDFKGSPDARILTIPMNYAKLIEMVRSVIKPYEANNTTGEIQDGKDSGN
jgi:signal transduction histidine kinase